MEDQEVFIFEVTQLLEKQATETETEVQLNAYQAASNTRKLAVEETVSQFFDRVDG